MIVGKRRKRETRGSCRRSDQRCQWFAHVGSVGCIWDVLEGTASRTCSFDLAIIL